jgi:signal transduction histidine kinase/ligand-binding sensor domain-containing protein/DNA-binding response OmpR family regulator
MYLSTIRLKSSIFEYVYPFKPDPMQRLRINVLTLITRSALLSLCLVSGFVSAPSQDLPFRHFTVENGLSHNTVNDITQDSLGFLWIATSNGLNRFNGYEFQIFESSTAEGAGLPSNGINVVKAGSADMLWVGTRKGICYWSQRDGRIISGESLFIKDTLWNLYNIGDIHIDQQSNVWVLAEYEGFHIFKKEPTSAHFTKELFLADPGGSAGFYGQIAEDKSGRILVGISRSGLWVKESAGKKFSRVDLELGQDCAVTCLLTDQSGGLWIGSLSGLYHRKKESESFRKLSSLSDSTVRRLYQDVSGNIWVGTDTRGLNLYKEETDSFVAYDHKLEDPTTLLHNSVKAIFRDRQNILWVGTWASGVSAHDNNAAAFTHFHSGVTDRNLTNNAVTAFAEDEKGNYWVATDRGGLNYFDRARGTFSWFRHDKEKSFPSSDIIQHILYTDGDLWIGNWASGLDYYDSRTGSSRNIASATHGKSLFSNSVFYIFKDSRRNLWFATGQGLNFVSAEQVKNLKRRQNVLEGYQNNPNDPKSISDNSVRCMFEDSDGMIWAGTWTGVNKFDPATATFENLNNNPRHLPIYTDDLVLCITETKAGNLVFGTNERGLLFYRPGTNELQIFNKSTGFPSSTVFGVQQDNKGFLWISTTNGLVKFNESDMSFALYTQHDGLPSNEFRANASLRTSTGHMLFGGNNGFVAFHPDAIQKNITPPKMVITQFRLFNEVVKPSSDGILSTDISRTDGIELSHDQSSLMFEFVALNFTAPAKNRYAYRLTGIDRDWIPAGTDRSASYSYIPPGQYTFQVQGSNNDGVWSEPVSLNIVVQPPWWETIWFRVLAGSSIVALGIVLYKRRTRQLHRKREILEEMVHRRTVELEHKNHLLSERQEEIMRQKEQLEQQRDGLEQQYQTIRMLSGIGQQLTSSIRKDELILQLYSILKKLMTVDHLSIGHLDKNRRALEFSTVRGEENRIEENVLSTDTESFSVLSIRTRQPIFLDDISLQYRNIFGENNTRYPDGYGSAMYLPLATMDGAITGVLVVKTLRANAYNELNLETLRSLAAYISIAFENATIYKEIEAQSQLLQAQSEKLDKLDKLKTNFFINLSHEFRTPLTLIISPLENILSQGLPADWARLHRQLVVMHKNARQLSGLINELLELRKLEVSEKPNLSVSRNDIVGFVRMILGNYEDIISQLKLDLRIVSSEPVIELWFDPQLMQKVMINLITNAVKYTPENGTIEIRFNKGAGGEVVISIRDTGTGIAAHDLPYVFERFYQGDDPLNKIQSGSGIGLAFIRDLVQLHGGTIHVESEKGRGTTFTIVLVDAVEIPLGTIGEPVVKGSKSAEFSYEKTEAAAVAEVKENSRATVLIVEDNTEVAAFLAEELGSSFHIILAENGQEGLDQCLNHMPDLIVSDVMLPVMDGMELCRILKDDFRTSHIPVLMLTAKSGEDSFIKGLNLGADDYVPKPFNLNILRARIHNLINSRKKLHHVFAAQERFRAKEVIENTRDRNFIEKLDACIERNLNNPNLNHEILSVTLGMSKTQLYRKLQSITGKSVHEYIRNYRLRIAREIMRNKPDFLVFEVAYEVGFKDPAYFSRCFHAFFNFWPTDLKIGKDIGELKDNL